MALDERTLRYLAASRHMNPDVAERYFSRPGAGGFVSPSRPTLARALQDLGGIGGQQTINVNTAPPRDPAGAAMPSTPDESALASQAGWAGANEAVAPFLGDWRSTPAQILAAAVGGYNRSRYTAQQDIAAQRRADETFGLQKQQLAAELAGAQQKQAQVAQAKAMVDNLPEAQRARGQILFALGQYDELAKMISPEPAKRQLVGSEATGWFSVDPNDPSQVTQAVPGIGRAPPTPPETWQTLSAEEARAMGYPEEVIVQRSSHGELKTAFKRTANSTGFVYTDAEGNSIQIGGSSDNGMQGVKLQQNYYLGNTSPEAREMGLGEKTATPLLGTPDYSKAMGVIQTTTKFQQKLYELSDLFDQYGVQVWPSEAKGQLESLANELKLAYADAKGQGALQKTDDEVISSVLGAVTSWWSLAPGGQDKVRAQIKQALDIVELDRQGLVTQYPWASIPKATHKSEAAEVPDPEAEGQTMMNKSGAKEPTPSVDNGAPSPAAEPPSAPPPDAEEFTRKHW